MKQPPTIQGFLFVFLLFSATLLGGPTITYLSPQVGSALGNETIAIKGKGFIGCKGVYFDSQPASAFIVNSDTSITALSPILMVGVVDVTVETKKGLSRSSSKTAYVVQGAWYLLVTNVTSDVTFLNLSNKIAETLFPIKGSKNLTAIAITPDGKTAYVVDRVKNSVYHIDYTMGEITAGIGAYPSCIAISPDGTTAYVTNHFSDSVSLIDIASNTVRHSIAVPGMPLGIAITPDGKTAYVTNFLEDCVTPIATATLKLGTPISLLNSSGPCWIACTPDGHSAYVVNKNSHDVTHIDIASNTVVGTAIAVGKSPSALAITPDGKKAYVTSLGSNSVTSIDLVTDTAVANIPISNNPYAIAIAPDGKLAYVTTVDGGRFITPIDVSTDTLQDPIPNASGGHFPFAIALKPDQAPLAALSINSNVVQINGSVAFDAACSSSPVGDIVRYDWDFGDGTTVSTVSPQITHTYTTKGTFTATLTVINSAGTSTSQVFTGQTVSRNGGPRATTSQTIRVVSSTPPSPPLNFKGTLIKTHGDTVLHATWVASPSKKVMLYRIYNNGKLIKVIKASELLRIVTLVKSEKTGDNFCITAVNANRQESEQVMLKTSKF